MTAVDAASLELALGKAQINDKGALSVKLGADATVALDSTNVSAVLSAINDRIDTDAKDVTIDLNGGAITWNGDDGVTFSKEAKITFKNGDVTFTGMNDGTAITVAGNADVVFDKVELNTGAANAVAVNYASTAADQGTFTAKDSTITSYGNVGVSIDAPSATAVEKYVTAVTLTNTNIVMTKAADAETYEMSTAMVVGAPVNVVIKNGEFSANQQALVVRGGDVDVDVVTIDARNSGLSADVISYTYNCYVDGAFQYEDNLNLVGFIAVAE